MGTQERRTRDRGAVRQSILEAAQAMIAESGFAALTMRGLAARVEYSPAALYLHFRSREQIAQVLSEEAFALLLGAMTEAAGEKRAPEKRLRAAMLAYCRWGLANPERYRMLFMSDSAYAAAAFANKSEDSAAHRIFALLAGAAQELAVTGRGTGGLEPRTVVELVWAAVHGVVSLRLTCAGFVAEPESMTRAAVDAILRGLRKGGAPGRE